MLWFYLFYALRWLARLLLPIPPATYTSSTAATPRVTPLPANYPCPVCGWPENVMRCIVDASQSPYIQRTCSRCGAQAHYQPISSSLSRQPSMVLPAQPEQHPGIRAIK